MVKKEFLGKNYKNEDFLYKKGDVFIVHVRKFYKLKNHMVKKYKFQKKHFYTYEQVEKDLKKNKLTRPLVVLYNDKHSNHILAIYETSFKNQKNVNWAFKVKVSNWNPNNNEFSFHSLSF